MERAKDNMGLRPSEVMGKRIKDGGKTPQERREAHSAPILKANQASEKAPAGTMVQPAGIAKF
jgi:hypothetical protein